MDELFEKYEPIIGTEYFDKTCLDREFTRVHLVKRLDMENVLDEVDLNSTYYLNDGTFVDGATFIKDFVAPSFMYFPEITVEEIIDKYVSSIEKDKKRKK